MNLNNIRKAVIKLQQNNFHFIYRGGRGQDDIFDGKIIKLYSRIFIIETNDGKIKAFSYSDFLIKTLKIVDFSKKLL